MTLSRQPAEPANSKHEARQPSWSRMRRALASIRFSPADRPRLASRPARSRTTSTTWTRSPDASFSRFALYRRDQSRASSPPLSTFYNTADLNASWEPFPRTKSPVPRMTAIGDTVVPRRVMPERITGRGTCPAQRGPSSSRLGCRTLTTAAWGTDGTPATARSLSAGRYPSRMHRPECSKRLSPAHGRAGTTHLHSSARICHRRPVLTSPLTSR